MNRRTFLKTAGIAATTITLAECDTLSKTPDAPENKPNVILIMADDMGRERLCAYGCLD